MSVLADDSGFGADQLLDDVEEFLGRFVAHPSDHARVAHVLWVGHTHVMEKWDSTPRIAFLSPEPGSGKSRALEVTDLLVPRPVQAVNTTPAYLFRKVSDEAGLPTILYDEIDTVFGPKAKDNEEIRGLLNAGHRKGQKAGRCVVRGATVMTEELDAYCAVALAGLDDLPDTIMSRSIVIRMRRRAPDELIEPFRHRLHSAEGYAIRDDLSRWAADIPDGVWPEMPDGIEDRNADVWEALLAVADAAGGDWPKRHTLRLLRLLRIPWRHPRAWVCGSWPTSTPCLETPNTCRPKMSSPASFPWMRRRGATSAVRRWTPEASRGVSVSTG